MSTPRNAGMTRASNHRRPARRYLCGIKLKSTTDTVLHYEPSVASSEARHRVLVDTIRLNAEIMKITNSVSVDLAKVEF